MQRTVAHFGRPLRLSVTLIQCSPPSRLTWTRPSSLPAQRTPLPFSAGDSARAKIVQYTSAPVLSPVIGPPDHSCLLLSSRVRSLLIAFQVFPPSGDRKRMLPAW